MAKELVIPIKINKTDAYAKIKKEIESAKLPSVIKNINCNDSEHKIEVKGSGVEGILLISDSNVTCTVELGFLLKPFWGEIESKLKEIISKAVA